MKNTVKRVVLIIMIISLFTSCSVFKAKDKNTDGMQNNKTELTLWYYWDIAKNQQELSKLIKEFNISQEKIEVKARYIPDEDFKKQLSLSIITKDKPDLVLIDSADQQYYSGMNMFVDLTDKIDDLDYYDPIVLNSCKMDDRVYGVPFGINCLALFYNEDMLKAAGCNVPTTWDEFEDTAKKLTNQSTKGFGMTALQSEESLYEFLPILWSYGGQTNNMNTPQGKQAFSLLQNLVKSGSMSKATANLTLVDLMNQFIDKKIAMMFNSPMIVKTIREKSKDLNWNVTFLPKDKENVSIIGGENWAALKGGNEEASIEFIKYITQKDLVQSYISNFGFLSAREDIMSNQYLDDPVMRKFYEIYQHSQQREITKKWPYISDVISNAMIETIMGEKKIEEVLEEAQTNMDKILEEEQ